MIWCGESQRSLKELKSLSRLLGSTVSHVVSFWRVGGVAGSRDGIDELMLPTLSQKKATK